jgi:hypothetical protein
MPMAMPPNPPKDKHQDCNTKGCLRLFAGAQSTGLTIGNYQLSNPSDVHVWIYNQRGEGGRFSADKLEQAIDAFFQENF